MKFNEDIKNFMVFTLITVLVWVGYEIYNVFNKSNVPEVFTELSVPLDPELDVELLNNLSTRKNYY